MNEPTMIYNDLVGRRRGKKRAVVGREESTEVVNECRPSEEQSAAVEEPEASVGKSAGEARSR